MNVKMMNIDVSVLTTHHHADHAGGNNRLLRLMGAANGRIKVTGADPSLQGLNHRVKDNEKIKVAWFFLKNSFILLQLSLDWRYRSDVSFDTMSHSRSCLLSSHR
jgi:metal-dependent hydrolase (beta-lactamase superfamily II)